MPNRNQTRLHIGPYSGLGRLACVALGFILLAACQGPRPLAQQRPAAGLSSTTPSPASANLSTPPATGTLTAPPPRQVVPVAYEADHSVISPHSPAPASLTPPAVSPAVVDSAGIARTQAFSRPAMAVPPCCPGDPHGANVMTGCRPWSPPGIATPWPEDEYLCDGGDHTPAVRVRSDWSVIGLDLEDTVVHYDTLDGETRVEPSNRVCLYAPRFAAVRRVHGIAQHERHERVAGVEQPAAVEGMGDVQIATTTVQPVQPGLHRGTEAAGGFRERTPSVQLENRQGVSGMQGALLPYEDFSIIRLGLMDNSEKARLAQSVEAAAVWSADQAVQVVIDNVATHEDAGVSSAESVFVYEMKGKSRLRVCKVASRQDARPGETVDFTIRFDNVGDQTIGNVTVIDNLTTRLEYVEGSQQCSLGAHFSATANQGESLVLRWEIDEPLDVTEGGIIRFQCRVR